MVIFAYVTADDACISHDDQKADNLVLGKWNWLLHKKMVRWLLQFSINLQFAQLRFILATFTFTFAYPDFVLQCIKCQYAWNTWWRHQMEIFFALLVLCAGKSPVTGEFPTQRPVTRGFDVSLICGWINGWVNNGEAGDLRRHRAHYDDIVMFMSYGETLYGEYILWIKDTVVFCYIFLWFDTSRVHPYRASLPVPFK